MMEYKEIKGIFEGPIAPVAIRIAAPIMVGNLLQLLYMIVDTYFISLIDLSSTALLSGTGLLFPLFFIFMSAGISISIGISSLVGRTIGEQNETVAKHISASGLSMALILGGPALVIGFIFGRPVVSLLAGSEMTPEALEYGLDYFFAILPGMVLLMLSQVFSGILQGEGRTQVIAKSMLISTGANIILDPLFIFGIGMGVTGAGLATTISISISMMYLLVYMARGKTSIPISFNLIQTRRPIVREIVRIGFPQFLNMSTLSLGLMLLNKLVGNIGEHFMNAWTIVGRLDHLIIIPAIAMSGSTMTMVAQNYGRRNLDRVRRIYRSNILLGVAILIVLATIYILLAPISFPLFTDVPEVLEAAVFQVRVVSYSFVGATIAMISVSAFQAVGRPYPAIVLPLARMLIFSVPLSYFFVYYYDMQMGGVYLGLIIGNLAIVPFTLFWVRFHLNRLTFKTVT